MLRVSSQGLGLPLVVIRVLRRARLLSQDLITQHVRAVWSTNATLILDRGCVDERENIDPMLSSTFPGSALSNRRLQDMASISTTLRDGKSHQPAVKNIFWKESRAVREHIFMAISGVVDGSFRSLLAQEEGKRVLKARRKMLSVLATVVSPSEAWHAFIALRHMIPDDYDVTSVPFIPHVHLHRLCLLLSSSQPKTHVQFLRLLSVLNYIRSIGGRIHRHEWNAVINHATKGWRKMLLEDWEIALSLYNDMVNGRIPGAELHGQVQPSESNHHHAVKPDIYTFNSLLNIAVKSGQVSAVRHALALMTEAGINPSRLTFLTLLTYHGESRQMSGVRATILKMKDQGYELGLDGINACMWAYGLNGHYDLVKTVYRLLRHNILPEGTDDSLLALARNIEDEEFISVPGDTKPDIATFTTVIQIMAYIGDLSTMLSVLDDMHALLPARLVDQSQCNKQLPGTLSALNGIFRAIFLGFFRHGIPPTRNVTLLPYHLRISNPPGQPQWSLQTLQKLFEIFITLPPDVKASRSTLHWIMRAFDTTSGQDQAILREVWMKLDERFGMRWFPPTNRLGAWKKSLFPEMSGDDMPGDSRGELEGDLDFKDDVAIS